MFSVFSDKTLARKEPIVRTRHLSATCWCNEATPSYQSSTVLLFMSHTNKVNRGCLTKTTPALIWCSIVIWIPSRPQPINFTQHSYVYTQFEPFFSLALFLKAMYKNKSEKVPPWKDFWLLFKHPCYIIWGLYSCRTKRKTLLQKRMWSLPKVGRRQN